MSCKSSNIMKITPSLNEISRENSELNCTEPNCKSTFQNFSNLNLHLIKHHNSKETKMNFRNKNVTRQYYCPYINCIYNINNNKYFKSMKYLRQHFVKVHAAKNYGCSKCDKQFGSSTIMRNHEKNCGLKFQCQECGWNYNSREALLTHARRKKHDISVANVELVAAMIDDDMEEAPANKVETNSIQTQTTKKTKDDEIINEFLSFGTQTSPTVTTQGQSTNNLNNLNYFEDSSNISSCFNTNQFEITNNLCDIETQTIGLDLDKQLIDNNSMYYSNTYTQTCADILTDLGLNDIQTQTNWNFDSDDLQLVSTETQTNLDDIYNENFNFNLLNSSIHTQTSRSIELLNNISNSNDDNDIINYNSIHTQT